MITDVEEQRKKNEKQRQKLCLREKELESKERDLRMLEIKLKSAIEKYDIEVSALDNFKKDLLTCELPESRDRMRIAFLFDKMCEKRLTNKYADTEYIKGLASILTGKESEESEDEPTNR